MIDIKNEDIVLLCVGERSGSNLLRSILETHSDVMSINATGFTHYVKKMHQDGPGAIRCWGYHLAKCVELLNRYSFEMGVIFDLNGAIANVKPGDFRSLILFPALQLAQKAVTAPSCVIIKEHEAWRLANFFHQVLPGSKLLIQYRHPAGYYSSCKKLAGMAPCYHGSIRRSLARWREDLMGSLVAASYRPPQQVLILSFEQVLEDSDSSIERVFSFIGRGLPKNWQNFYLKNVAYLRENKHLNLMWDNLDKPISAAKASEWKDTLKHWELSFISLHACGIHEDVRIIKTSLKHMLVARVIAVTQDFILQALNLAVLLLWTVRGGALNVSFREYQGQSIRSRLPFERFRDGFLFKFGR